MKKVYVHLEDRADSSRSFTTLFTLTERTSAREILVHFTSKLNVKVGRNLNPSLLGLKTECGKVIGLPSDLVYNRVLNKEDLFVYELSGPELARISAAATTAQTSANSAAPPTQTTIQPPPPPAAHVTAPSSSSASSSPSSASSSTEVSSDSTPTTSSSSASKAKTPAEQTRHQTRIRTQVQGLIASKQYRAARILCEKELSGDCPNDPVLLKHLCQVHLSAGRGEQAVAAAEKARRADNLDADVFYLLAKSHILVGNFDDAEDSVRAAIAVRGKRTSSYGADFPLLLQALLAESIYGAGRHNEAAQIVNAQLGSATGMNNVALLAQYSRYAIEYDKVEEPLHALLKAITVDQGNKDTKELMSRILGTDRGYAELLKQIPPKKEGNMSQAYAFISSICREYSALTAALNLLKEASKLTPFNPHYVLNQAHIHENLCDLSASLGAIAGFFMANRSLKITSKGPDCGQLAAAMAITQPVDASTGQTMLVVARKIDGKDFFDVVPTRVTGSGAGGGGASGGGGGIESGSASDASAGTTCGDDDAVVDVEVDSPGVTALASAAAAAESASASASWLTDTQQELLTDKSLDLLALGFTAVKILFNSGRLACLPHLIQLLEPARKRSEKELHQTNIRNEQAYYLCLAHVMALRPSQPPFRDAANPIAAAYSDVLGDLSNASSSTSTSSFSSSSSTSSSSSSSSSSSAALSVSVLQSAASSPLFFCGDSHCQPPAWSVLTVKGRERLLVPKLVTGCKHWHLRPESKFYPKADFFNTLKSIPDGSEVVFLFGEIDCREGLLVALERDRYPSLEAGMEATIRVFVNILNEVIKKRRFKVYIHPVLPVLPSTRHHVLLYNSIYKKLITTLVPGAHWLDFDGELLNAEGDIREEFKLDGTHANPVYLRLVEQSIDRL